MNTTAQATQQNNASDQTENKDVLFGRLMLPDQSEHPFQISQISVDGATLLTQVSVPNDIKVVAYIDEIGRVEGRVIAQFNGGIALEFITNESRRKRLKEKLTYLDDNDRQAASQRRHARFEPKDNKSHITMPDGRIYKCEVIDISLSGAALKTNIMPNLGTFVMLGKMRGRVVRYVEGGIALEFSQALTQSSLSGQI